MKRLPRLAASHYLNAAPVVYAFAEGSQADRCEMVADPAPSACAAMLAAGEVDGALVPAVEYQRIPGLAVARGVCIAAREAVRSVLLVARRPLDEVRSVALDTQSRTSAALVRILLGHFRGLAPVYRPAAPDLAAMLERDDAALLIGDPAMTADTRGFEVYDLARMWRAETGLPFVFALWAVWPERVREGALDFEAARREGVAAIPRIAARHAPAIGLSREEAVAYLTSNIHYEPDEESLEGLRVFFRLAAETGLAPHPRDLRFWPSATTSPR